MFVDEAQIMVAAGRGGDGAVTFHREKYQPRGGPDGGNGGRGGSVILVATDGVGSLSWLRDHPHQKAASGTPGGGNHRNGADAGDLTLAVPPGTVVHDSGGQLLADLARPGDRYVVAAGGRGGRGNAAFLSDARRAPGFGELGEPGISGRFHLELRLIADVAVIGLPNAGKSTLVGALSAASPKVAAYPFTTLEPTLGRVVPGDDPDAAFTICDIPGLIEGAHEGRGLGLGFLRHAERALLFMHLVDVNADDPLAAYRLVRSEVISFKPGLEGRPEIVGLNKVDVAEDGVLERITDQFVAAGLAPVAISAAEGTGLDALVARLAAEVAASRAARAETVEGFELFRTERTALGVSRDQDGTWRLSGDALERWVVMTDLANAQAVAHLQERMERAGVERVLAAAGAEPGDEVRIGEASFEWFPTDTRPRGTRAARPAGR
ncbi:MAG TPA: GTPase ObgE [Actinomycetota bacterium]|nr:GTPase ObgE [Actinomycetota bacterium]